MNKIPDELLFNILQFSRPNIPIKEDKKHLALCCLVCRRWFRLAQPMLFEQVEFKRQFPANKKWRLLHRSLSSSNILAGYVRGLSANSCYSAPCFTVSQKLIGDCLELMTELETLVMEDMNTQFFTNDLARQICCLPKLKKLALIFDYTQGPKPCSFDPQVLFDLPRTIEEITFSGFCPRDLMSLLPEICAKLKTPKLTTTTPPVALSGLFPGIEAQRPCVTGLRGLNLYFGYQRPYSDEIFAAIGHSAPMLTSLTLGEIPRGHTSIINESMLGSFLSATPLLEHLYIYHIRYLIAFDALPPLRHLRSLGVGPFVRESQQTGQDVWEFQQTDEEKFCKSLNNFIGHCEHLRTFDFRGRFAAVIMSQLIDGVITSTTKDGAISSLQSFEIDNKEGLPIGALEHLCRSAPLLQKLHFVLSDVDMCHTSCAIAIGYLKDLVSVYLKYPACNSLNIFAVRGLGGDPINISEKFAKLE